MLAALLGAAGTFILTSLKASRDEQRDLCDRLGEALLTAADLASEYWLTDGKRDGIALLEARLMGAQAYLARYRVMALSWFSPADRWAVEDAMAELYDALTGGEFKVSNRAADLQRAETCQVLAASLAVTVYEGNVRSLRTWPRVVRWSRWHTMLRGIGRLFQWQEPRR